MPGPIINWWLAKPGLKDCFKVGFLYSKSPNQAQKHSLSPGLSRAIIFITQTKIYPKLFWPFGQLLLRSYLFIFNFLTAQTINKLRDPLPMGALTKVAQELSFEYFCI